jgi:site-specific recombinase XerD
MNGASSLEIAAILGHKTLQMTQRYAHLSVDHLGDVLERLNQGAFGHV